MGFLGKPDMCLSMPYPLKRRQPSSATNAFT